MKKFAILFSSFFIFLIVGVVGWFVIYPIKYKTEIKQIANYYNLDCAMVFSIIKIESGFDNNSVSSAGAIGLMQLMPSTANECANKIGLQLNNEKDLFIPSTNIEIGCYYLRYLLDYFDSNLFNTLASYNWGITNVINWLDLGNVDENGSIINIPSKETQNYISKYQSSYKVYKNLYKL